MIVTITSFSYKRGLPEDMTGNGNAPAPSGVGSADERSEELSQRESRKSPRGFVFDCRAMPNPYWDESLRWYIGRDKPIADFFAQITVRSVYFAERMAERLAGTDGVEIELTHAAKPFWKEREESW